MEWGKRIGFTLFAALFAVAAVGCDREGPAEQTGEQLDESFEQGREQLER